MKYKDFSTKIRDDIQLPRYTVLCTLYIMLCAIFSSCKKDKPNDNQAEQRFQSGKGVFVLNEGNFNWGNASVDYISFDEQSISLNIFQQVNGFPVGDVLQSCFYDQGKAHLVVNNSGRIHTVNPSDFKHQKTVSGMASPRYIAAFQNKLYVSDLYANRVHILNRGDLQIKGSIPMPGWVEQMLVVGDELILVNVRKHKLYFVNCNNDQVVDSIAVADAPAYLQKDKDDNIWVLSQGELFPQTAGALTKINPQTRSILHRFSFAVGEHPSRLQINASGDTLYYINNHAYKIGIYQNEISGHAFINGDGKNYYTLGINPLNDEFWIADAIDFVQPGRIEQYNASGNLIQEYRCGIIPGGFWFY